MRSSVRRVPAVRTQSSLVDDAVSHTRSRWRQTRLQQHQQKQQRDQQKLDRRQRKSSALRDPLTTRHRKKALRKTNRTERARKLFVLRWSLRAPRRHRDLARVWIQTHACARCGVHFTERENLGAYNCSAHPFEADRRTRRHACCGVNADPMTRTHVWWGDACTRAHHIRKGTREWNADVPQRLFEIVPASLFEVHSSAGHSRPFIESAPPRGALFVGSAEAEQRGIVFESVFTTRIDILYPHNWSSRTKRIGMSMDEAARAENVRRGRLTTFSYLKSETKAETPQSFFEPYYLIPRIDVAPDNSLLADMEQHLASVQNGSASMTSNVESAQTRARFHS